MKWREFVDGEERWLEIEDIYLGDDPPAIALPSEKDPKWFVGVSVSEGKYFETLEEAVQYCVGAHIKIYEEMVAAEKAKIKELETMRSADSRAHLAPMWRGAKA